ncbi:PHP domain-containing protein [Pricia sp. S334]|uniref:PHP domain-containing protein n=1 Tax=Pricia mediterranea TaxID=3076079 RepID=A0ABU3L6H2_9FLAO|nr:PHP domain-containing protein [Pricia sp. S334]MDT7828804.1 PHP domain-containing protein [Pricia sp. S334]
MNRTKKQNLFLALVMLSIIILSTVFQFKVHFEDALLQSPAPGYKVDISIWRIIFEPILGPLLYLNRSLYVLEELPLALFWGFIFYVGYSAVKKFRGSRFRRDMLYRQLANLPLIIGLCFALFVVVLFIPLPNNTIRNTTDDTVLVTSHAHTEFSHDGLISQENMWKWHKRNGFDAFFITDHANHKKSLEFSQEQKEGKFPIDPLVLVGQEFSGTNHMSLLGLNGEFETKGMEDKAVIDSVHRYGGAVIINHWFDGKGRRKEVYAALGADGFEIENTGTDLYYDRDVFKQLRKFCEENGLIMIGGLDFHGYGKACSLYNAFEIPDWDILGHSGKKQAVLNILKEGPQEKIKILIYKDRPFYPKANLVFRPFLTTVNYFRTLNWAQILSWALWIFLFQSIVNRTEKSVLLRNNGLLVLSNIGAIFLMGIGVHYYLRGKAVIGYNDIYSEYSLLLGPIGLGLLLYVLAVAYYRFSKRKSAKSDSVHEKTTINF